jgi:glycosyltransferase involved in cell wall biosynthesis
MVVHDSSTIAERRYLIVGNNTHIGFILGESLVSCGRDVVHLYVPRQAKRCFPEEYFDDVSPPWSHRYHSIDQMARAVRGVLQNHHQHWKVLCSGEIESCLLTHLGIDHYWIVDGADLSENPFRLNDASVRVRQTLQSSKYLKGILTNQRDHRFACRLLGLSDRLERRWVFPMRPPLLNRARRKLDEMSGIGSQDVKTIFSNKRIFSATRRVYSGAATFSKGTEKIVEALKELKQVESEFSFTLSGPDADRFKFDVQSIGLKNIKFLPHLFQKDLLALLNRPSLLILDQFGEAESVYSGMLRESMISGLPIISDHLFDDAPFLEKPLGLFSAYSGQGISTCVFKLLEMHPQESRDLSCEIIKQALRIFDPRYSCDILDEILTSRASYASQ